MRKVLSHLSCGLAIVAILLLSAVSKAGTLDCSGCHPYQASKWQTSSHANTQDDVAAELAEEWAGLPPDSVINGSGAENCVACHAPTAVNTNGGMTEVEVMNFFFTTIGGVYTSSTVADSTSLWPHDSCTTCHNVEGTHPLSTTTLANFNSTTAQYDSPVPNAAVLCGQCHGDLRFADTDHRLYNAWSASRHGSQTQVDVAGELAEEWAGVPPDSVINGSGAENCIACHSPTATKANGGISEAEALNQFFTTTEGVFTASTTVSDTANWPYVSCLGCHDPHNPDTLSYFNSTTRTYEVMSSSDSLCGQCHGGLRFPDTDHLSYNLAQGTGGVGVPDLVMMPGVKCVDCHMANDALDGSVSVTNEGHSWEVFIPKTGSGGYASCGNVGCHSFDSDVSRSIVASWQTTFQQLVDTATAKIAIADSLLLGSTDSVLLNYLAEAKANLAYAESDESGGAHNANYVQSLLQDAIDKAQSIPTDANDNEWAVVPQTYSLLQNYPNPFNPSTQIAFTLPRAATVRLEVFNLLGQSVNVLLSEKVSAGEKVITWSGCDGNGEQVVSGIYFYRLTTDNFTTTKKMILLR